MWAFLWALADPRAASLGPVYEGLPEVLHFWGWKSQTIRSSWTLSTMEKTRSNFIHFPISFLVLGHVSTWHWLLGSVPCSPGHLWASSSWNNGVNEPSPAVGALPAYPCPCGWALRDSLWSQGAGGFCCYDNRFVWILFLILFFQFRKSETIE